MPSKYRFLVFLVFTAGQFCVRDSKKVTKCVTRYCSKKVTKCVTSYLFKTVTRYFLSNALLNFECTLSINLSHLISKNIVLHSWRRLACHGNALSSDFGACSLFSANHVIRYDNQVAATDGVLHIYCIDAKG